MSMSVALEVDENEESETVALLRRHERERIRVNKLLNSLDFKLDSARGGVDSGVVRPCFFRKAFTSEEAANNKVVCDFPDDDSDQQPEIIDHSIHIVTIDGDSTSDQSHTAPPTDVGNKAADHGVDEEANYCSGNAEKRQVKAHEAAPQSMGKFVLEVTNNPLPMAAQNEGVEAVMISNIGENDENKRRDREVVLRMVKLMTQQLRERNEALTGMLNELTHRVEHMEKACSKIYLFTFWFIIILIVFYIWG